MARAWRIEYEGALYYVLSHGNEKQDTPFTIRGLTLSFMPLLSRNFYGIQIPAHTNYFFSTRRI